MSEEKEFLNIEFRKKRPKKNAKSYQISTVQDIFDCVTPKNIKKFLREFEMVIRSFHLMKAINDDLIQKGQVPSDVKVKMPSFEWIDD